jgi:predicted Zn-dependent protease
VPRGFSKLKFGQPSDGFDTDDTTSAAATASAFDVAQAAPPNAPDPLEGLKWASKSVTWSFAAANVAGQPATFSGFVVDATERALFERAAAMWQAVSGLTLTLVPDSANVDIRVGFAALDPSGGGAIGLTSYNSSGDFFLPDVAVTVEDPGQHATTQLPDGDLTYGGFVSRFYQVLAHEFGHALGLTHNTVDDQALMYTVSQSTNRSVDPNDVAAIQQLYGANAAGNPTLSIIDNGPANFVVAANATVNPFASLVVSDGPGLHETLKVTVTGGGTLSDPVSGTDAAFSNGVFTESGDNLKDTNLAQSILNRLVYTPAAAGAQARFQVEVDNSLQGTASDGKITINAAPAGDPSGLAVVDTTTGQPVVAASQPYSGPVSGLTGQYIAITADSLNITATTPNWFIHSGSGTDAIDVSGAGGTNVLDGSTGSNFLTGGSGNDTFFLDDRNPVADVFSTIVNFHSGDNATIFGVNATDFAVNELDNQGVSSALGLDFAFSAPGHANANIVLAGFSTADLASGRLTATYGTTTDLPGLPGSQYLNIHAT